MNFSAYYFDCTRSNLNAYRIAFCMCRLCFHFILIFLLSLNCIFTCKYFVFYSQSSFFHLLWKNIFSFCELFILYLRWYTFECSTNVYYRSVVKLLPVYNTVYVWWKTASKSCTRADKYNVNLAYFHIIRHSLVKFLKISHCLHSLCICELLKSEMSTHSWCTSHSGTMQMLYRINDPTRKRMTTKIWNLFWKLQQIALPKFYGGR